MSNSEYLVWTVGIILTVLVAGCIFLDNINRR